MDQGIGSCQLSFPTVLLVASNAINSFTGTWAFTVNPFFAGIYQWNFSQKM